MRVVRIEPLTSLRFFAAAMVVANHLPATREHLPTFFGQHAVTFFFVLSGFILTYVHWDDFRGGALKLQTARRFWLRRFARIYPLHLMMLLVFALWGPHLETNTPAAFVLQLGLLQSWVPSLLFSFNQPAWSISDEAFFYAVFPFVALALVRARPTVTQCVFAACIIVLPTMLVVSAVHIPHQAVMYNSLYFPLTQLPFFLCGVLVAHVFARSELQLKDSLWTTAEIVVFSGFLAAALVPIAAPLAPTVLTAPLAVLMVFVFAHSRGMLSRLFSARPLVYLGEVSFAIYMVHLIIVESFPLPVALAATLIVAVAAHELVERPAQNLIQRVGSRMLGLRVALRRV
jgi:peptidoglycan/LPS O-acetylase OafA/YrhL